MCLKLVLTLVGILTIDRTLEDCNDFRVGWTTEHPDKQSNTLLLEKLIQLNFKQEDTNRYLLQLVKKNLEEKLNTSDRQDENKLEEDVKELKQKVEQISLNISDRQDDNKLEEDIKELKQKLEQVSQRVEQLNTKIKEVSDTKLGSKQYEKFENKRVFKDCLEIKHMGYNNSGVYNIQPRSEKFEALCDLKTKGGGWTIFHNRFDGFQSFERNYTEYKLGFGNISGEFWLGLEHLYQLTENRTIGSELLIQLVSRNGTEFYAHYHDFTVENEAHYYLIPTLDEYDGNAGNALKAHTGWYFSENRFAYASAYGGGWWYCDNKNCITSNLNGRYFFPNQLDAPEPGMMWGKLGPYDLKAARMMIRQKRPNSGVLR